MRKHKFDTTLQRILLAVGILIILCTIATNCYIHMHKYYNTGIVIDKAIKRYDDKDKYLIFIKDENNVSTTYEITDSLYPFRYNSSDLYGYIETGYKYEFELRGYRIPILSMYPNIYKASKLEE